MESGLDRVLAGEDAPLRGKRLALLTNQSAVTRDLEPISVAMAERFEVVKLFAPEHGLYGIAQDQVAVGGGRDPLTGVPVVSLYGATEASLSPRPEDLEEIDLLVYDIQDVGVRYYTFVYTLALAMRACKAAGKGVLVLDRPNPITGIAVEGNVLDPAHASFVGLFPIPVRHGMTSGELARLFNEAFGIGCALEVISMKGWRREMWFDETGLPWVQPSPNMPTLDTATVYAGTCLLEGTNVSEGRGTTRPFEIVGAPWIEDPGALAAELNAGRIPGVRFRPLFFEPTFHKWQGTPCGGVQLHVTNRDLFPPFTAGIFLIETIRRRSPHDFAWRTEPYEFGGDRLAFDMLCGTTRIREAIEDGIPFRRIAEAWKGDLAAFQRLREEFLVYS